MPTYEHICEECGHEWEEFYSINADPPEKCPKCDKEAVKRLISGGAGRGIVELVGGELKEKVANDVKDMKRRLKTDDKFAANFYGESKFNGNINHNEKANKELKYIKNTFRRVK